MKIRSKIFLAFILFSLSTNAQIITTYVGNGTLSDYDTGDGNLSTSVEIGYPEGMNLDDSGNLLICEYDFVRKINKSRIISTVAGSDTASSCCGIVRNGVPATTVLLGPVAVCVDKVGNYYLADEASGEVRIVDKNTNIINAYAGNGHDANYGDGGPATSAAFNTIGGVCIDTARSFMYISDAFNYRVRKVDMVTGIITAYAGTGTNGYSGDGYVATNADFSRVVGIALDKFGNLYIGDWDNGRIRRVDVSTGIVTTFAGNGTLGYYGDGGPATNAMINKSTAMCFDSCGNMYFTDENNQRVRRIDAVSNIIATIAGNGTGGFLGDGGPATSAEFNHPTGICIDKIGNLYVSDYYNQRVRRIVFDTLCDGKPSLVAVNMVNMNSMNSIYPNPTNDILNIDNVKTQTSYRLYDIMGAAVQEGVLQAGNNSLHLQVLPSGLYLLEFTDGEGKRSVTKIVKE